MKDRTGRWNCWLLASIGALLVILGAGGVTMGARGFGADRAGSSVIYPRAAQLLNREQSWLWWVLGAAALVIALLAVYWLIVQLRVGRIGTVTLSRSHAGDSSVSASALAEAIRVDALALPEVDRAKVRLVSHPDRPEVLLAIWLHEGVDLGAVRQKLEHDVLRHARESLGLASLRTWLRIELDAGAPERVR